MAMCVCTKLILLPSSVIKILFAAMAHALGMHKTVRHIPLCGIFKYVIYDLIYYQYYIQKFNSSQELITYKRSIMCQGMLQIFVTNHKEWHVSYLTKWLMKWENQNIKIICTTYFKKNQIEILGNCHCDIKFFPLLT